MRRLFIKVIFSGHLVVLSVAVNFLRVAFGGSDFHKINITIVLSRPLLRAS